MRRTEQEYIRHKIDWSPLHPAHTLHYTTFSFLYTLLYSCYEVTITGRINSVNESWTGTRGEVL